MNLRLVTLSIIAVVIGVVSISSSHASPKAISYLALGDSYTICESVAPNDRWPNQLSRALVKGGVDVSNPEIIAKTGWRCDQLYAAVEAKKYERKFDLVSLLIGVNNEFQGWIGSKFKPEFERCLDQAVSLSKRGKEGVFVLSIPDYGYSPFGKRNQEGISKGIDEYNAICKEVCKNENILYLEITDISRLGFEEPELVADDGLHPSAIQYSRWIERIESSIRSLLE